MIKADIQQFPLTVSYLLCTSHPHSYKMMISTSSDKYKWNTITRCQMFKIKDLRSVINFKCSHVALLEKTMFILQFWVLSLHIVFLLIPLK